MKNMFDFIMRMLVMILTMVEVIRWCELPLSECSVFQIILFIGSIALVMVILLEWVRDLCDQHDKRKAKKKNKEIKDVELANIKVDEEK